MKTIFPEDLSRAHIGGFVASEVREILLRGSTTCWLGQFSSDHVCRREIIRSPGLSGAPGALVSNHPRAHLPLTVSNVDHTRDRMRKETPARTVSWWSCWWCTSTSASDLPFLVWSRLTRLTREFLVDPTRSHSFFFGSTKFPFLEIVEDRRISLWSGCSLQSGKPNTLCKMSEALRKS